MGSFSDFSRQDTDPRSKTNAKVVDFGVQMIAIGVLLGALVIATGVAPVSWIKFERKDGQVRARVSHCAFFIVPYHIVHVESVHKLDTHIQAGSHKRKMGRDVPNKKADDNGYLEIIGATSSAEVSVAPSSLPSVKEKAQVFLADPQAKELKLFVVANWLFSLVFSGLATFFGLIIAGSFVYAFVRGAVKRLQRKITT